MQDVVKRDKYGKSRRIGEMYLFHHELILGHPKVDPEMGTPKMGPHPETDPGSGPRIGTPPLIGTPDRGDPPDQDPDLGSSGVITPKSPDLG